jgi:hypothetical protein
VNADQFNALYEVGIPVFAYPGCRPEDGADTRLVTRTRSKAEVLGGHTDVVWVDGHSACIALSHVDVVTEAEYESAKTADAVADQGALPVPTGTYFPLTAEQVDRIEDASIERLRNLQAWRARHPQAPEMHVLRAAEASLGDHMPAVLAQLRRTEKQRDGLAARLEAALHTGTPEEATS